MKAIHMYIKSRALELLFPNGPVIMWLGARSQALRERYWSALKLIFFILVSNEQKVPESGVAAPESSQHTHMRAHTHKYGILKAKGWPETLPSVVFPVIGILEELGVAVIYISYNSAPHFYY